MQTEVFDITSKADRLRELGRTTSTYWHAYGAKICRGEQAWQTWMDLPRQEEMFKAAIDLMKAIISVDAQITTKQYPHIDYCIDISWAAFPVRMQIWRDYDRIDPKNRDQIYETLPKDMLAVLILPGRPTEDDCRWAYLARTKGSNVVLACPDDIDALGSFGWTLSEMLYYKILRLFLEGAFDVDAIYVKYQVEGFFDAISKNKRTLKLNALSKAIKSHGERPEKWVEHPRSRDLEDLLEKNPIVLLVGESSSGKTVLSMNLGKRFETKGETVLFIDVGQLTEKDAFMIGVKLFDHCIRTTQKTLVVLDDLQCQPKVASDLISLFDLLRKTLAKDRLHVLATCWSSFSSEASRIRPDVPILAIEASDVKNKIIHKFGKELNEKTKASIEEVSGDDLLLLCLSLEMAANLQGTIDREKIAEVIWQRRTARLVRERKVLTRTMFVASVLGQFECDFPASFLKEATGIAESHLNALCKLKLLRFRENEYSLPHRSFAKLIAEHLGRQEDVWSWFESRWKMHGQKEILGEIMLRYLNAIEPQEIWRTLELVDRAGGIHITSEAKVQTRTLTESWKSIRELLTKILEQQKEDPTWGRVPSSATFACEALAAVGKVDSALGTLSFIRECYRLCSNKLEIDISNVATTTDFEQISERMKVEDQDRKSTELRGIEAYDKIDFDVFHKNWLCGLILCAENALKKIDPETIEELSAEVEKRISPDGYYYPSRVPWCTARVLMGLGASGRTIKNSEVVRQAAKWLLRSKKSGGAREGRYWKPGTGTWNTTIETTALCIIGLRKVEVPANDQVLSDAINWLFEEEQINEWGKPGYELDAATALQACLVMGRNIDDVVIERLRWLSEWANGQAIWRNVQRTAIETRQQTCRIAQIAAFLMKTMWDILRIDLPDLLVGLGIVEAQKEQKPTKRTSITSRW